MTAFAQADGFLTVPALAESLAPGTEAQVTRFGATVAPPRLAIVGSHCVGLDAVVARLAALRRRECDLAPIHLLHAESGDYNRPFLAEGMRLIPGSRGANRTRPWPRSWQTRTP